MIANSSPLSQVVFSTIEPLSENVFLFSTTFNYVIPLGEELYMIQSDEFADIEIRDFNTNQELLTLSENQSDDAQLFRSSFSAPNPPSLGDWFSLMKILETQTAQLDLLPLRLFHLLVQLQLIH